MISGLGLARRHDDRIPGHRAQHVGRQYVGLRDAEEDVGAVQRLGQGRDAARGGELPLLRVEVLAVGRDDTPAVAQDHLLAPDAHDEEESGAGQCRGSGAVDDHAQVVQLLSGDLRGVEQGCRGDDRRAVLVVVHDGDVELLAQARLDLEALGCLDVLEIDAAEGRGDGLDRADERLGIGLGDLDVEGVDAREGLEEHALALHDGLRGEGPDVAQSQNGRAVRDDGHEVAAVRVAVDVVRRAGDGERRRGHAGRVGQGEVVLRVVGFCRHNAYLARAPFAVVAQGGFVKFAVLFHGFDPLFSV